MSSNSQREVRDEVLYMMNPVPSLRECHSNHIHPVRRKIGSEFIDSTNMDNPKRPPAVPIGARDAADVFISLLRAEQTSSSNDDLFQCLCIMKQVETAFSRASMCEFFSHWEKMTVAPLGRIAIKFRERWR